MRSRKKYAFFERMYLHICWAHNMSPWYSPWVTFAARKATTQVFRKSCQCWLVDLNSASTDYTQCPKAFESYGTSSVFENSCHLFDSQMLENLSIIRQIPVWILNLDVRNRNCNEEPKFTDKTGFCFWIVRLASDFCDGFPRTCGRKWSRWREKNIDKCTMRCILMYKWCLMIWCG